MIVVKLREAAFGSLGLKRLCSRTCLVLICCTQSSINILRTVHSLRYDKPLACSKASRLKRAPEIPKCDQIQPVGMETHKQCMYIWRPPAGIFFGWTSCSNYGMSPDVPTLSAPGTRQGLASPGSCRWGVMAPSPNPESPLSPLRYLSLSSLPVSVTPLTPCLPLLSPHLQLMALE